MESLSGWEGGTVLEFNGDSFVGAFHEESSSWCELPAR